MTTASELESKNLKVIADFLKEYPQHRVEFMGTVIRQGGNPLNEEAYNPVRPNQLKRWLYSLATQPIFEHRRLIISMKRLVSFDSFDGPVSLSHLPDRPVTLIGIESNWMRYIESIGTSFEDVIKTRIDLVTDNSPWVFIDEIYKPMHKTLANDISREFFWRRLDAWIKGSGGNHEVGHNEDLPKSNHWFINRCVREFVEHLYSQGELPEQIILMEQGAARAELTRNFLVALENNYPDVFLRVHKVYIAEFSKDILDHMNLASHLREQYSHLVELVYYHPHEFPNYFYDIDDNPVVLRGKVHFLTHNNVFDQLASRLIRKIEGQCYEETVKLYLDTTNPDIAKVLKDNHWSPKQFVDLILKATNEGLEHLIGSDSDDKTNAYPHFDRWMAILSCAGGKRALQLHRKLEPIEDILDYFAIDDEKLKLPLSVAVKDVFSYRDNCQMLINQDALDYYARSFELLTADGQTQMTNLFCEMDNPNQAHVRDVLRMDGSLITSLNANLFQSVAARLTQESISQYSRVGDFVAEDGGTIRGIGLGILRTKLIA